MPINSCLVACNLLAKRMMEFLTASESVTLLGSPLKFKVNFKNDSGEGGTCYPTVSTCNYHVAYFQLLSIEKLILVECRSMHTRKYIPLS